MAAAALYGAFLGVVMFILTTALPAAVGWTVFWTAVAIQLGIGAVLVWRRTSLPMMTAGFVWAAGVSVIFGAAATRGLLLEQLFWRDPVLVPASLLVAPALMFSERWLHPQTWQRLKRASDECSFLDILAFRHIPDVRVDGHSDHVH